MKIVDKIKIFVEDAKRSDGTPFKKFSTTVSSDKAEGGYVNKSLEVRFGKTDFPEANLMKLDATKWYEIDVTDGWLGVRQYQAKDGSARKEVYVFVNHGKLLAQHDRKTQNKAGGKSVAADPSLPF